MTKKRYESLQMAVNDVTRHIDKAYTENDLPITAGFECQVLLSQINAAIKEGVSDNSRHRKRRSGD